MNETLVTERTPARASKTVPRRDPLYLFACHVEWHNERNLRAFQDLLAALDDPDEKVRIVAEILLGRPSPRRKHACTASNSGDW